MKGQRPGDSYKGAEEERGWGGEGLMRRRMEVDRVGGKEKDEEDKGHKGRS